MTKLFWPVLQNGQLYAGQSMPVPWFVGNTYGTNGPGGIHTGVDFNLPNYADTGKAVHAVAAGRVTFADHGKWIGWPDARNVVVVEHAARGMWTRYAHLGALMVAPGSVVIDGQPLAVIGDYGRPGPFDDHLHFDMAVIDLGARPGDWPGAQPGALTRVLRDYLNPFDIFRIVNYG